MVPNNRKEGRSHLLLIHAVISAGENQETKQKCWSIFGAELFLHVNGMPGGCCGLDV